MAKILLFGLLWYIFGNPFVAILVLLAALYFLDRRFVGLTPSFVKPLKRRSRIAKLRQQLSLNRNDVSAKMELARLLLDKKDYAGARRVLETIGDTMEHSAEYWDDLGTAYLHTGKPDEGEQAILQALDINPRVKYGEPYLRLASVTAGKDAAKALGYLEAFRGIHSSSCEGYYRMGRIYKALDRKGEARRAFEEALDVYRTLPRYKKRGERGWALRSFFAKNGV